MKMNSKVTLKESLVMLCALAVWLAVTALCVGFRTEHIWLALLIAALFFACRPTRRLVVALLPFIVFGISYDWMNIVHNYEVNPVDIRGLYESEKQLFGITAADGTLLTPNEFFALHRTALMDFLGGVFYLCWVPVPIIFGLWMYFSGKVKPYLHFALVFLLVNLIGFAGYYIHPAAPPWYVALHGFDFRLGVPGDVAGLGALTGEVGGPGGFRRVDRSVGFPWALRAQRQRVRRSPLAPFGLYPGGLHLCHALALGPALDSGAGDYNRRHMVHRRIYIAPLYNRCASGHHHCAGRLPAF